MNVVVLLAGGSGTRMQLTIPKQHILVEKHQIIEYTLESFSACNSIDAILVASNPEYKHEIECLKLSFPKLKWVIDGGKTRIDSVCNSVRFLETICASEDKIIISDSVRPCIFVSEIEEVLKYLDTCIAVTTGIESYETILKVRQGEITEIIPREGLIRQTSPEGYKFSVLKDLYAIQDIDTIRMYQNIGIDQLYARGERIGIVKTSPLNFKITTQEDLFIFETILRKRNRKYCEEH